MMFTKIKEQIVHILLKIIIKTYRAIYLPIRVFQVRRKKVIKVAFILSDLGKWKTETLYNKMLQNKRFEPVIIIIPYKNYDNSDLRILVDYLNKKQYKYFYLDKNQKISDVMKPDIIFYQEPYNRILDKNKRYKYNLKSLFCYVNYAFHTIDEAWSLDLPLLNLAWQVYYENSLVVKSVSNIMTNKGKNCIVTGLPYTELFFQTKLPINNPWNISSSTKKKIIWAPHHTILNDSLIHYSTFLKYCNYMLSLAEKYKEQIQVAFKPHPLLRTKLYEIWGIQKTEDYYARWAHGRNTQLVLGDYVSLFLFSDAMIHDCGSFTVEYHHTKKPIMYLIKDEKHAENLNEFGKKAFNIHYLGRCEDDIESFVINVLQGKDIMKKEREKFYNDYLIPPNGKSASENIINAILGN